MTLTSEQCHAARADISAVILCGGDARRMQGVHKALQPLNGLPLVAHVHAHVAPQVARVIISANRALADYGQWADTVLVDDTPNCGPLGGVATALRSITTPYLFCCPGDAPFLHGDLVARLASALEASGADIARPHDGERDQHLFLLLRTGEQAALQAYLEAGGRSVHGWLSGRQVVPVDASDIADHFANINTEQELAAATIALRRERSGIASEIPKPQ